MTPELLRADYLITDPSQLAAGVIRDGAVVIRNGRVLEAGPWAQLAATYQGLTPLLEPENKLVIPGLINAHHHARALDTRQVGMKDKPLELWLPSFLLYPATDTYLETKLCAARLLRRGVTTSLQAHSHPGPFDSYERNVFATLKAYRDAGVRVAFAMGHYDQQFLAYEPDEVFRARLPERLKAELLRYFAPDEVYIGTDEYFDLFATLVSTFQNDDRVQLLLNPIGLHWASAGLLKRTRGALDRYDVGFHVHLLETRHQATYARKTFGKTGAAVLADFDLLGERSSVAHAVYSTDRDIELYAETDTTVTTNPSSNLRLGSGRMPLPAMLEASVSLALGTDSMSLFGEDDLLSELTLLQGLYRPAGHDSRWLSPYEALAMATVGGAKAATLEGRVGKLLPGYDADLTVLDLSRFNKPSLSPVDPVACALSQPGKAEVEMVLVRGDVLVKDQKLTRLNLNDLEAEQAESLRVQDVSDKQRFLEQLEPYLRRPYSV